MKKQIKSSKTSYFRKITIAITVVLFVAFICGLAGLLIDGLALLGKRVKITETAYTAIELVGGLSWLTAACMSVAQIVELSHQPNISQKLQTKTMVIVLSCLVGVALIGALLALMFGGLIGAALMDLKPNAVVFYLGGFLCVASVLAQAILDTIILAKAKK